MRELGKERKGTPYILPLASVSCCSVLLFYINTTFGQLGGIFLQKEEEKNRNIFLRERKISSSPQIQTSGEASSLAPSASSHNRNI